MTEIDLEYEHKYAEIVKRKVLELFNDTSARVFLFGSRARGDFRRGADFDIGIESVEFAAFQRLKIQFDIFWEESIIPYKVDFVYFDKATSAFVKAAKKDMVIWKED